MGCPTEGALYQPPVAREGISSTDSGWVVQARLMALVPATPIVPGQPDRLTRDSKLTEPNTQATKSLSARDVAF